MTSTPAEYAAAGEWEREQTARQLHAELQAASDRNAPWYVWVRARHEGTHLHDLTDDDGRPVACPVAGCTAVVARLSPRRRHAAGAAMSAATFGAQLEAFG